MHMTNRSRCLKAIGSVRLMCGMGLYLDYANLLEEICHRVHGIGVSKALYKDGVVVRVILVWHYWEHRQEGASIIRAEKGRTCDSSQLLKTMSQQHSYN